MPQYHHQWSRESRNERLGATMTTQLWYENTGSWITSGWQLVSTATLDGRQYEYLERIPKEPGEFVYRRHRGRAATDILRQKRGIVGPAAAARS